MSKTKRGRGPYPPEFRREAVELYRSSGKSLATVAAELGIAVESLRNWKTQDEVDRGEREGLSTDERERLKELERENRRLRQEREILKRAAAFFARESETR
jgi:transposase